MPLPYPHVPDTAIDANFRELDTRVGVITSTGVLPSGTAGGVLDGTYPDPGLNGSVAGFGLDEAANVLAVVLGDFNLAGTHAARPAAGTAGRTYFETDTHILYRDSGSAWQATGPGYVPKTITESVNNSTTLQNDDEFFFPIEVGEVWYVELILNINANSTAADWKFDWSLPTGVLGSHGVLGTPAEGAGFTMLSTATGASPNANVAIGTPLIFGSIAGSQRAELFAEIRATGGSATAGTCTVQWAQNTATPSNNNIGPRSLMRLTRII